MILKKDNLEFKFLPSAMEIEETPPSPLGRLTIWIIFSILLIAILWACIGKVDEVASARGKVIPDGNIKVVQPLELSVITNIYVSEGQYVKKGQLLIELDSHTNQIDIDSTQESLDTARLERDIYNAEIKGASIEPILEASKLPSDVLQSEKQRMEASDSEYSAKVAEANSIISQKQKGLDISNINLIDIVNKRDKAVKEEAEYKDLYNNSGVSKEDWQEKSDNLETSINDYQRQLQIIQQSKESLKESQEELQSLKNDHQNELLNLIIACNKKITDYEAQLNKDEQIILYQKLYAPVDGTVSGLTTYTVGGIVTPAQAIMSIVPSDAVLIIEASVLNKDIGFIKVGQETEIKLDTFPFQRYGTIKGEVVTISPDAYDDKELGLVYKIKIKMSKNKVFVMDRNVSITPGMTATAEVKTGKRRIISFFLDPLMKNVKESIKLR